MDAYIGKGYGSKKVDTGGKLSLEEAAQILVAASFTRHPCTRVYIPPELVLSPERLKELSNKWEARRIFAMWDELESAVPVDMLRRVEKAIKPAYRAEIVPTPDGTTLRLTEATGEPKVVAVENAIPMVAGPKSVYAHRMAVQYVMMNPPYGSQKGKSEVLDPTGRMTYDVVAPWTDSAGGGAFSPVYDAGTSALQVVSGVEQVMLRTKDLKAAMLEVGECMEKALESSCVTKLMRSFVIDKKKVVPVETSPTTYTLKTKTPDIYWGCMLQQRTMARMDHIYMPFYCAYLPLGVAHKVDIITNLKNVMALTGVAGMSASSSSSAWIKIKYLAVHNMLVSSPVSTTEYVPEESRTVGEFREFSPVLDIHDVASSQMPTRSGNTLAYSPAKLVEYLIMQGNILREVKGTTNLRGYVTYLTPDLWDEKLGTEWAIYPLDPESGRVVAVFVGDRKVEKLTQDQVCEFLLKFALYRIQFPFTRVTWPRLRPFYKCFPIVIKEGQSKNVKSKLQFTWEWVDEEVPEGVPKVPQKRWDELENLLTMDPELPPKAIPVTMKIPDLPLPKFEVTGSPAPQLPPAEVPPKVDDYPMPDDEEDFSDMVVGQVRRTRTQT